MRKIILVISLLFLASCATFRGPGPCDKKTAIMWLNEAKSYHYISLLKHPEWKEWDRKWIDRYSAIVKYIKKSCH